MKPALRVLLFVEPRPLAWDGFLNAPWLTLELALAQALARSRDPVFELHLVMPKRFLPWLGEAASLFEGRVHLVDESLLVRQLHAKGQTLRAAWIADFHENPRRDRASLGDGVPAGDFDIVLSFGEPCRVDFGAALYLAIETSSFSRWPFALSWFFDAGGMFRQSAPAAFADHPADAAALDLAERIRSRASAAIASQNPLALPPGERPRLLLPLQASGYASFDAQDQYDSQLDYLFDVCSRVDPRVDIVVTEHPGAPSLDLHKDQRRAEGLRQVFPNLIVEPRARFYQSASFLLLGSVQGVWSVASNVAPVARLLGREVGTPKTGHLSYAATAASVEDLCARVLAGHGSDPEGPVPDPLSWMLSRYVVPHRRAMTPDWIGPYLRDRLDAWRRLGASVEAYVPTGAEAEDFFDAAPRPHATDAEDTAMRLQVLSVDQAFVASRGRPARPAERQPGPRAVIVNDTARLEGYRHEGCNAVNRVIRRALADRGIGILATVNDRAEYEALPRVPQVVIVNAEGTFHHNAERATGLLDIAEALRERGGRIAFVNALWEANTPALAQRLARFDLVSVRDSASKSLLAAQGVPSLLVPDLSFGHWAGAHAPEGAGGIVVTDSVRLPATIGLMRAARHFGSRLMLLLDNRQLPALTQAAILQTTPRQLIIRFWHGPSQLVDAELVLTGRFHVAAACVACGIPFAYVPSNSDKLASLCRDAGLDPDLHDVGALVEREDWAALGARLKAIQAGWSANGAARAAAFSAGASAAIAGLFDRIAAPVRRPAG